MIRFSLTGRGEVSLEQFHHLVSDFHRIFKETLKTECSLVVRVLSEPKVYTTFVDETLEESLAYSNRANTILETNQLVVAPETWNAGRYVEVIISPVDPNQAPPNAYGRVEFKGAFPNRATFLVQPDRAGKEIKTYLQSRYPRWVIGDGCDSHGRRSRAVPSYVASAESAGRPWYRPDRFRRWI